MSLSISRCEALRTQSLAAAWPSGPASAIVSRRLRRQVGSSPRAQPTRNLSTLKQAGHLTRLLQHTGDVWSIREERDKFQRHWQQDFEVALRNGDPDTLRESLQRADRQGQMDALRIDQLPRTTFHECLRLLDPEFHVEPYKNLTKVFTPVWHFRLGVRTFERIAYAYMRLMDHFLQTRRSSSPSERRYELNFRLKCASTIGNAAAADKVWKQMASEGIARDTNSYAWYINALAWNKAHYTIGRQFLRVNQLSVDGKKKRQGRYEDVETRKEFLAKATDAYNEMKREGIQGDEMVHLAMITVNARLGNTKAIATILNDVWGIDVLAILESDGDYSPKPFNLHRSSPLYPTERLLFVLAHAYGTCNDLAAAMRLVDYASLQYSLPIPPSVWEEFLQWAHVLSIHRPPSQRALGRAEGALPRNTLSSIWSTMTSPPYNIVPTPLMQSYYLKHLSLQGSIRTFHSQLTTHTPSSLLKPSTTRRDAAYNAFITAYFSLSTPYWPKSFPPLARLRREHTEAKIACIAHEALLRRTASLVLWSPRVRRYGLHHDWERRVLPAFIGRWARYLPERIFYEISTGKLEFALQGDRKARFEERYMKSPYALPRVVKKMGVPDTGKFRVRYRGAFRG
ncbi:MAG: hypothetical protein M1824_002909 [Vezdaea acicularis]|nr:MAG: hypothetical protein M1824_002909 [Vezdaea acicularis]